MKKLLIVSLTLIAVLFYSCSKDDNPDDFKYEGTWSGVYTGNDDNGSWTATINSEGAVTGSASSNIYPASYTLTGTITSEGAFNATAGSASTGTEFVGQFNGTTASGTWSNASLEFSGTWSGTKE